MTVELRVINERQNPQVESFVNEHAQGLLDKHGNRLETLEFHIQEEGHEKKLSDKRCSVNANLLAKGMVHVSASDPNVYTAIQKAIAKLEALVAKKVSRSGHAAIRHAQGRERLHAED